MNNKYKNTMYASFLGLAVQSIVNNFIPLLFITLQHEYSLSLVKITFLITITFGVQFLTDIIAIFVLDKFKIKSVTVFSHFLCSIGLFCLAFLPNLFSDSYLGLVVCVVLYSIGAGMLEVILSPIVEHCPTVHKEKTMSILHSFYCFGHVGVIVLSTLFFFFIGIEHWKLLCILWSIIPLMNGFFFMKVEIPLINEEVESDVVFKLFNNKMFWVILVVMICAGASEIGMSQWASTFVENTFGVSKAVGDLLGPMTFALMMAISRVFYGIYGHKIQLNVFLLFSAFLCFICYVLIGITNHEMISFISFAICGFSVGILWPGVFSLASSTIKGCGTTLFAILALAGDIGCTLGPTVIGTISSNYGDSLTIGILFSSIFPFVLVCGLMNVYLKQKN